MSSPARSWSLITTAFASRNCSRYALSVIVSESTRPCRFAWYQLGRGQEPVTVVGSITSLVVVNIRRCLLWTLWVDDAIEEQRGQVDPLLLAALRESLLQRGRVLLRATDFGVGLLRFAQIVDRRPERLHVRRTPVTHDQVANVSRRLL